MTRGESEQVCGKTSRIWDIGWDSLRIARFRIFEYVYGRVNGQYVESPASGGAN